MIKSVASISQHNANSKQPKAKSRNKPMAVMNMIATAERSRHQVVNIAVSKPATVH
jgi:transcriptional regulator of met regulon